MNITIFTDGSSRGNPGPGGWGAIVVTGSREVSESIEISELGGGEKNTTNNRMELMAAAKAFSFINKNLGTAGSEIDVYTDSAYLINGITKWVHGWKKNGWKTKTKEDVLNKDLWLMIDDELNGGRAGSQGGSSLGIKWHHIGGHVGIVGNERCDEIATAFASGGIDLYSGPVHPYQKLLGDRDILDISHDADLAATKKSSSSRSAAKAYSYVSKVNGKVETHKTWLECEKRVKGMRGVRFKKALNKAEELEIIEDFRRI